MSNRYRDSMDRLHFTQEQKQEMVDRLMAVSYTHLTLPTNSRV